MSDRPVNDNLSGKHSIFGDNFDKMEEATMWLAIILSSIRDVGCEYSQAQNIIHESLAGRKVTFSLMPLHFCIFSPVPHLYVVPQNLHRNVSLIDGDQKREIYPQFRNVSFSVKENDHMPGRPSFTRRHNFQFE